MKHKRWTDEEIKYLRENWLTVNIEDMELDRTKKAIEVKACNLKLNKTGITRVEWTKEDEEYLEDNWGSISIPTIAKNLNMGQDAVQQKARRLGLGAFLDNGEYLTINSLSQALFKRNMDSYTKGQWIDKGFPIKSRKVKDCSFSVIYIQDFWEWAEMNSTLLNFSNMEPLALGKEPEWLEHQRRADIEKEYFKKSPWTTAEDNQLRRLLDAYRYSYRELSLRLKRTEGAIKRRMIDLEIKARPIKMPNHNPWTKQEIEILIDLYHKGHSSSTMANYINRSSQACSGKVERLIKEGDIFPRSEYRSSC